MSPATQASEFFVAGGTLHPDSPSYIKRPADEDLFGLALAGKFCYVLTARQMGKSSLMIRTDRRLKEHGVRTAIIDLTQFGTVAVDQWYLGLLTKIRDDLELSVNPETWWAERASLGAVQRFTRFLREVVLKEIDRQVVIFVDEIDTTLRLNFADDFFAAIRAMYNARANDPEYNRLTFVLLGVATPADLIRDKSRTPFNIGQAIDLREFRWEDTQAFRQRMAIACPDHGEAAFARIFYWTKGHPYLTQKLCWVATEEPRKDWNDRQVDELVKKLFLSEEARKESNLQFVRNSIATSPQRRGLLGVYRKVYEGKTVQDDEHSLQQSRLKLFGLVRAEKGKLRVRNEIYRQAFNLNWIKTNTPVDWTRRIAIVSTMLVLILASLVVYSLSRQRQQTAEAQAQAFDQQFKTTTSAEVRITSLAGLFPLPGHENQARQLFNELTPADQLAMFNMADPRTVAKQLITVVKGLYTDLGNNEQGNALLGEMAQSLRKLDDPAATNLATEMEQWLKGRAYYAQGEYQQALKAYYAAISLNPRNPGTHLDEALAYARLGDPAQALADLVATLDLNSGKDWQDRVRQALASDDELYAALWKEKGKYGALAALAPMPTSSPAPVPATRTPVPPTESATSSCSLSAGFVADVTIPDGTSVAPGSQFVKTWRVKNSGTCDWGAGAALAFTGGDQLGGSASAAVPPTAPGGMRDLSLTLKAPASPGAYTGRWQLRTASGAPLTSLTVSIVVAATSTLTNTPTWTPTPTPTPTRRPTLTNTPTWTPTPTGTLSATIEMTLGVAESWHCQEVFQKTADVASVDATSGRATLNYTIQNIYTETYSSHAQISDVTVANSSAGDMAVDIVDTLYCDAGGGVPGTLVTEVFRKPGTTLSPGQGVSIPGGSFDVSVCGLLAVNRVQVFRTGTTELVAAQNSVPSQIAPSLSCPARGSMLQDVETLPAGYSVDSNSIVVRRGGQRITPMSAEANGNQFTIGLAMQGNTETATWTLQIDIVRGTGSPCQPAVVDNVASLDWVNSAAQIELTCQQP